jgi:hypothetical protein
MSSFSAFGFFALAQGKRVATYPAGATFPIHHNHYITSLKSNSDDVPNPSATLRVYSVSGDAPLPDNTIAFVVAKVSALTGKPVEMDVLYLAAFPGDPNDDQYEVRFDLALVIVLIPSGQERIPACPVFVYGVGHVPATHTPQSHNDGSKLFTLSLTEYVSGTVHPRVRRSGAPFTFCLLNLLFTKFPLQLYIPGDQALGQRTASRVRKK